MNESDSGNDDDDDSDDDQGDDDSDDDSDGESDGNAAEGDAAEVVAEWRQSKKLAEAAMKRAAQAAAAVNVPAAKVPVLGQDVEAGAEADKEEEGEREGDQTSGLQVASTHEVQSCTSACSFPCSKRTPCTWEHCHILFTHQGGARLDLLIEGEKYESILARHVHPRGCPGCPACTGCIPSAPRQKRKR